MKLDCFDSKISRDQRKIKSQVREVQESTPQLTRPNTRYCQKLRPNTSLPQKRHIHWSNDNDLQKQQDDKLYTILINDVLSEFFANSESQTNASNLKILNSKATQTNKTLSKLQQKNIRSEKNFKDEDFYLAYQSHGLCRYGRKTKDNQLKQFEIEYSDSSSQKNNSSTIDQASYLKQGSQLQISQQLNPKWKYALRGQIENSIIQPMQDQAYYKLSENIENQKAPKFVRIRPHKTKLILEEVKSSKISDLEK